MAFNSLSTKIFKLSCTYLHRETTEGERRGREKEAEEGGEKRI
jgi:hypothetical protein